MLFISYTGLHLILIITTENKDKSCWMLASGGNYSSNLALQYSRKCFGNSVTTVVPGLVMLIMITNYSPGTKYRVMMTILASEAWPRAPDHWHRTRGHLSLMSDVTPRQSFKLLTLVSQRSGLVTMVLWHISSSHSWHSWHSDAELIGVIFWPLKLSNENSPCW